MNFTRIKDWKGLLAISSMLLFSIYPVLVLYAHNVDQLVLKQIFLPIFFSLLMSTFIQCFWQIILKNNLQAGLATVSFLIIFWNYGLIYVGITRIVGLNHWHLVPILLFIYFHLAYFITRIKQQKTLDNLNTIVLVPIFLLVLFNIITILPSEFRKHKSARNFTEIKQTAKKVVAGEDYPDICLIILDEYASIKTIKEEWGYNNDEFSNFLTEKRFFLANNSVARYSQTEWNISCLLNINYMTGPVNEDTFLNFIYNPEIIKGTRSYDTLNKVSFDYMIQKINKNYLTLFLKNHGYKIILLGGVDQLYASFKIENADYSVSYQNVIESEKYSFLLDAFNMELIKKTIISPFDYFLKFDHTNVLSYDGTNFFFSYLRKNHSEIKSPKFTFAHILCPHTPYVFDRNGNFSSKYLNDKTQSAGKIIQNRVSVNDAYLDQYIYVTSEIENIIKKFDKNSVLIIQSDHGPRPHTVYLRDKFQAFNVFNAVYFPDGDYSQLYDSIAPINTLRVVLNKYFGENFKMLEDR